MAAPGSALALDLDRVLGDTRPLWDAWLEDAARRFPLDRAARAFLVAQDRAEAARELDRWAEAGVGDWRALLERFAEDRAPLHLRPNAEASAALRRLEGANVRLGAYTDAPDSLARVAVSTLGLTRRLEAVERRRRSARAPALGARPRHRRPAHEGGAPQ